MITGRCPRCLNGQLTIENDEGWQEHCIQCSYIRPRPDIISITKGRRILNSRQFDVSVPYTSSPSECTCVAYNTIPMFARQNSLFKESHGRV
jgi:hypothetical protein